ncbi:MAG: methyltransferase domain-containing protein [Deltaproteobacteria bacterium]|nr:methyltransferase domain-containing protein [Deltaproteobacteria bacterium]
MPERPQIVVAKGGFLAETYRTSGLTGCLRKIGAALSMNLPLWFIGRRTNRSVGAYFDLITDDARLFYGDCFHFGYFKAGTEGFAEALAAHTDLVGEMARLDHQKKVLDIGCGIGAPAIQLAKQYGCSILGVNISGEQVRQGRELVAKSGLSNKITISEGNALALTATDSSIDSILCLEVAGDICVTKEQKTKLIDEMYRVLKPGGSIGFSDLVFTGKPSMDEEKAMRMILYHSGAELVTDWPALFEKRGFVIQEKRNILPQTMKTWDHTVAIYEERAAEVDERYGKAIANKTRRYLREIPKILQKYAAFPVLSIQKPLLV